MELPQGFCFKLLRTITDAIPAFIVISKPDIDSIHAFAALSDRNLQAAVHSCNIHEGIFQRLRRVTRYPPPL